MKRRISLWALLGSSVASFWVLYVIATAPNPSLARGLKPKTPFVGNGLWVTAFTDPDGYKLDFESPTTIPEETVYSDDLKLSTLTQK